MTLIVDDTVSVWGENINRVIQVEPYLYFPNKSEVNNPAGKDIDSTIAVFKNNKRKKERNVQPSPVTDDIQNGEKVWKFAFIHNFPLYFVLFLCSIPP